MSNSIIAIREINAINELIVYHRNGQYEIWLTSNEENRLIGDASDISTALEFVNAWER
jgi:hypothetical protein